MTQTFLAKVYLCPCDHQREFFEEVGLGPKVSTHSRAKEINAYVKGLENPRETCHELLSSLVCMENTHGRSRPSFNIDKFRQIAATTSGQL